MIKSFTFLKNLPFLTLQHFAKTFFLSSKTPPKSLANSHGPLSRHSARSSIKRQNAFGTKLRVSYVGFQMT